jgi:type IV pilus assembly protein PilX
MYSSIFVRPRRIALAAPARNTQRGVALIVSLILLLVVTIIGLAAIRLTSTQEKMAGNAVDRTQAFQVAEATLQFAAATILPPANPPDPASFSAPSVTDCANSSCRDNPAAPDSGIPPSAWIFPPTTQNANSGPDKIVVLYGNNPSYLIQYMGTCSVDGGNFQFTNDQNNQGGGGSLKTAGNCYRITARANSPEANGAPSQNRAQVVLQAIYRTN